MVLLGLYSEGNNSHNFTTNYHGKIDLTGGYYEVALFGGTIEFSWDNIHPRYKNNILNYYNPHFKNWVQLIIPSGYYDTDHLTDFMHSHFGSKSDEECPIVFDVNDATRRVKIGLERGYKIDFSVGELHKLLGFEPKIEDGKDAENNIIYKSNIIDDDINEGKYEADINRGIIQYLIHCSIVDGSYLNAISTDVIYYFYPQNAKSGELLNLAKSKQSIYLPVNVKMIHEIRMSITDQLERPVYLNNRPVFYQLDIRKIAAIAA